MNTQLNHHPFLHLFDAMTMRQRIVRTMHGLQQHPDSGEYKWARLQILRLWSPASAVFIPVLVVLLFSLLSMKTIHTKPMPPVRIIPDEPDIPVLDAPPDLPELTMQPPHPDAQQTKVESEFSVPDNVEPAPDIEPVEALPSMNAVARIVSTVKMKNVFAEVRGRGPGGRGSGLKEGGAPKGSEDAVYRSLRWLKMNQESDGSWNGRSGGGQAKGKGAPVAMTGLALLTYLAHGETHQSSEFGETVKKAMEWLLRRQKANGEFDRRYQHAIAAYALCETYTMTRLPKVRDAAMKAVDIIIRGQNPSGGWRYKLDPSDPSDSSCMGWCVQALKAAKLAGFKNKGLDEAMERSLAGFKALYRSHHNNNDLGGFGYTSPAVHKLTGVGVVCNQLLGASDTREARAGLLHLVQTDTFKWPDASWKHIYYWYYNTQARFNEGGRTWDSWNAQFARPLIRAQTHINKAMKDPSGHQVDVGYWDTGNEHGGRVMDTVLCTLMLEVYYRYLPTYKTSTLEKIKHSDDQKNELDIDITLTSRIQDQPFT